MSLALSVFVRVRYGEEFSWNTISLVARKIGESAVVAVASAEYRERKGEPTRLSDLDRHDGVIFVSQDGPRPWTFASRAGVISYQAAASFAAMMANSFAPRSLPASVSPRRLTGFLRPTYAPEPCGESCAIVRPARIPISAVRPPVEAWRRHSSKWGTRRDSKCGRRRGIDRTSRRGNDRR
jgi:hypothetical protein